MKLHVVFANDDQYAGEIVATALARSFTPAQLTAGAEHSGTMHSGTGHTGTRAVVWINPPEDASAELARLLASGGKAVVLGRIGPRVAAVLGLQQHGPINLPAAWADCPMDPRLHHDASAAAVRYQGGHPLSRLSPYPLRPLCRFDFANEWNNLGFGRITLDGTAWSLQSAVEIGDATPLANLLTPEGDRLVYAALRETAAGVALWFNRPVGPVDSLEWAVVESFLGDYRADDLPCFPYLGQVPAGYSGAACARLDCDEAVASCRPLVELYRERGLPISLAILTGQPLDAADLQLMREVISAGGSVVSHSERHAPNWGGSYEAARAEALASRDWIEGHLTEALPLRWAVSPFHQNPPYAVQALADSGYQGFAGGIIANDPEYLLGRPGRVPLASRSMVSLSTQCMLHGDCFERYGRSIDAYGESFDAHHVAGAIFGYLDHPFSSRYQYGWPDETTRIGAHARLIEHIGRRPDVWWASLGDALEFVRRCDAALVEVGPSGTLTVEFPHGEGQPPPAIHWKGRKIVD